MTSESNTGTWESFTITEVGENARVVNEEITSELDGNISEVTIYPNPTTSSLNIASTSEKLERLMVCDVLGRLKLDLGINDLKSMTLDVSSLKSGIYCIYLMTI